MVRQAGPLLPLALLLLGMPPAWATTLLRVDVPQLSRAADVVVHGFVRRADSRWSGDGRHIITDVEIEVRDCLKGALGGRVTLVQPGGQVGAIAQRADGLAHFTLGEEVVVFLARQGPRAFAVAGAGQGKFRVERPPGRTTAVASPQPLGDVQLVDPQTGASVPARQSVLSLAHLKRQVRAALGTPRTGGR